MFPNPLCPYFWFRNAYTDFDSFCFYPVARYMVEESNRDCKRAPLKTLIQAKTVRVDTRPCLHEEGFFNVVSVQKKYLARKEDFESLLDDILQVTQNIEMCDRSGVCLTRNSLKNVNCIYRTAFHVSLENRVDQTFLQIYSSETIDDIRQDVPREFLISDFWKPPTNISRCLTEQSEPYRQDPQTQ